MSLESIGTHGKISVSCETSYDTNIKSFTADTVVSSHNKTHLECEQQYIDNFITNARKGENA